MMFRIQPRHVIRILDCTLKSGTKAPDEYQKGSRIILHACVEGICQTGSVHVLGFPLYIAKLEVVLIRLDFKYDVEHQAAGRLSEVDLRAHEIRNLLP